MLVCFDYFTIFLNFLQDCLEKSPPLGSKNFTASCKISVGFFRNTANLKNPTVGRTLQFMSSKAKEKNKASSSNASASRKGGSTAEGNVGRGGATAGQWYLWGTRTAKVSSCRNHRN